MRRLVHVVALAGLCLPVASLGGSAFAADLDHYYEPGPPPYYEPGPPPPVAVLPPPQVPLAVVPRPCVYGPCRGPYARFYPPAYAYERPAYAPIHREGYGYDYDRERFERAHEHFSRYGYDRPRHYDHRDYDRREQVERYERRGPYRDPLGYDRPARSPDERFGGYDRHDEERFDRYDRG